MNKQHKAPPSRSSAPKIDSPSQTASMLQMLVNNVQDYAVILLDPEGKVLSWNAGAELLKGWKASEIIGKISPDSILLKILSAAKIGSSSRPRVNRAGLKTKAGVCERTEPGSGPMSS